MRCPGFELGLQNLPSKFWYLPIDDDLYAHTPSFLSILSTSSSLKAYYIGNTISAYTCRFAHGELGIVFFAAALYTILPSSHTINSKSQTKTSKHLMQAKTSSLTSPFGDLTIAELARQHEIYVNEEYELHFYGENSRRVKISEQRACVTLVGFRKMGVEEIGQAGQRFDSARGMSNVLRWWDVWGIEGKELMRGNPKSKEQTRAVGESEKGLDGRVSPLDVLESWDYVGNISDQYLHFEAADEIACMDLCAKEKGCLAWTWGKRERKCVFSDRFTVGYERADAFSGLDFEKVGELAEKCGYVG